MIITFSLIALFFLAVIVVLQRAHVSDKSFTDYAVADRSFGAGYQAMSFLNTWWPGSIFLALTGLAVSDGVTAFYMPIYSLLTVVLMYVMTDRVWHWGKLFDLKTQPDLFALRYNSRTFAIIGSVVGILSGVPWLVLGFKGLGALFQALSLGAIDATSAVMIGVVLMAIRQFWTIRMGMRGVVISDMFQGIVAYIGGSLVILGLIAWLIHSHGVGVAALSPTHLAAPGLFATVGPLYFFSLIFSGVVGGWCWPATFVRLYTADSVRSVQRAGALGAPLSLLFSIALVVLGLLASLLPEVAAAPDLAWFTVCRMAGGPLLLGLGGVVVLAGTMGNVDGNVQACGAQIANDIVGAYVTLDHKRAVLSAKLGMLAITLVSAWLATRTISHLVTLAILSYQGIIQLAVPQYLGIFWKRGNAMGSILGTVVGFILAIYLQTSYPDGPAWAWGLTSGVLALGVNAAVYLGCAVLLPHADAERQRVDNLFALTDGRLATPNAATARAMPQTCHNT
ncbi:MAG TPA: sodium:solute symporter family protein [Steroidobacteraceae bacterium]|nr:sodium:solute symporter family protein [Steroidobacteraceae bacterium]